jgi:integrase
MPGRNRKQVILEEERNSIMAKQRGHGEGSVYHRKDGRWAASITLEGRRRKTFYGKTRKEVQEQLKIALRDQQQGMLATGPQQTVKAYLEHWLEEVHKPTIHMSSYIKYRRILNRYIFPSLGHIQVQKLTPQHVQALYAQKLKEGLAAETVRGIHRMLHKALDDAVRWNLVPRNVCDAVTQPRPTRYEIRPLTGEQAQLLLEKARGSRLETILIVALTTGIRRGELLALQWQDINFDEGSLHVCRTMNRIEGKGIMVSEPKTAKSRRKIMLPHLVIEALKQHRVRQLEARLKAGAAWKERDLVFCNASGNFLDPANVLRMFGKLLRDAGLPHMRFHDLRHSAATILLTMGVHPKIVQELLGHSQISMTMDTYSHVLPSMQKEAMSRWDDWFREQS